MRCMRLFFTFAFLTLPLLEATAAQPLRLPSAAGDFYPEDGATLLREVRALHAAAHAPERAGKLVACVAPHAAYGLSGEVAAHAFKNIQPGQYDRVIILAPSHVLPFEGCSIPNAEAFVTPLGEIPLDNEAIRKACYSSLISTRSLQYGGRRDRQPLHETEHSIEVLLPFLQERIGQFKLVPILVGQLQDPSRPGAADRTQVIADELKNIIDDRTLIVVSTDFTHYGKPYRYSPFDDSVDTLTAIRGLDKKALELVVQRDTREFSRYLKNTGNPICGRGALQLLMRLLPTSARGELEAYMLSAEKTGAKDRSVSYAAITFYDPAQQPNPVQPLRQLLPSEEDLRRAEAQKAAQPAPPAAPLEPAPPATTAP